MEGTAKYYINGVLQPAPAATAGPPLVINGITVPAGGNLVIVYEAEVNPYAPLAATGNIVKYSERSQAEAVRSIKGDSRDSGNRYGPLLNITV